MDWRHCGGMYLSSVPLSSLGLVPSCFTTVRSTSKYKQSCFHHLRVELTVHSSREASQLLFYVTRWDKQNE
ncbi:hypothetical protein NDU88_002757 [Pleurodeles waltl]|uniref:Secreted protein n=1 Tax=Pleurodeles waltl TaxID=8319 RepID=A0AAV7VBG5_PLEWA|nr:hypothetical protein NDU88_002757 [Pleurodeles waltl]